MGNPSEPKRNYATEAERILRSAEFDTQRVFRPLGAISVAIVQASTNCRDAVSILLIPEDVTDRQEKEVFLFFEFIYFFMHATLRTAFGRITHSKLKVIQCFLLSMIPATAIDSCFADLPDKLRSDLNEEFVEKLDEAELEYGSCTGDGEVSRMFALLAGRLTHILGHTAIEKRTLELVIETVIPELQGMQLETHISEFAQIEMSEQDQTRMCESLSLFGNNNR